MPAALSIVMLTASALLCTWGARRDLNTPAWATLAVFALAALATGWAFGAAYAPLSALVITCALIVETDRRHHLIPDVFTLSVLMLAFVMPFGDAPTVQLFGAAALGGTFLIIRQAGSAWRGAEALGWGDVKLAAAMGAVLGPMHGFAAVAIAGAATLLMVAVRPRSDGAITLGAPFGIGLAAATARRGWRKRTRRPLRFKTRCRYYVRSIRCSHQRGSGRWTTARR
ncbi:MAG: A24 family peptidase [Terricaulis sp.]